MGEEKKKKVAEKNVEVEKAPADKAALRKKIKAERAKAREKAEDVVFLAAEYLGSTKVKLYEMGGKIAFAKKNAPKDRMSFKEWEEFFKKY